VHLRETFAAGGGTSTDTLHVVWAAVAVPTMMLIVALGAASLGKRFRVYSIATIVALLGGGIITSLDGPKISANLPTPWVGVWERLDIVASTAWEIVLAVAPAPAASTMKRRIILAQEDPPLTISLIANHLGKVSLNQVFSYSHPGLARAFRLHLG
jgi:hypothetical protein